MAPGNLTDEAECLKNKYSLCWKYNYKTRTCNLQKRCIQVECAADRMKGFLHTDALVDGSNYRLDQDLTVGRNCSSFLKYDPLLGGVSFDLRLGECGMVAATVKAKRQNYIKFSQTLAVSRANPDKSSEEDKVQIYFGFHCLYQNSIHVSQQNTDTLRAKIDSRDVTNYGSWESAFKISMFGDSQFSQPLNALHFHMGSLMYFKIHWELSKTDFPVLFSVNECGISRGQSRFEIVKKGCLSDLVTTRLHSAGPYQATSLNFSFRTFSFVTNQANYDLKMDCDVQLCLESDVKEGKCKMNQACTYGYHPQI